ncbi:fibroblast growth factor receptor 1-like [Crassostrea angulata]|uniref:fibroblast growth factor receptor 1-like n=1 Tax=Magallana angulata TaxID=2784310 RepID=UPI0022B0A95B|nr:fibroblast growth factor receptor 1-like [Crassostrea angulata]
MKSFCELSYTLLFLCGCLFMSVDCQKKNKGTSSPLVLEKLQNATVMEGERVVLRCRALNDPNATSRWIKHNSGSANVIKYSGTELVIKNATVADTGIYICMVRNHIWLKLVDVWVTVKQTTTSSTTTESLTTIITFNTTTTGLQICMCVVYVIYNLL